MAGSTISLDSLSSPSPSPSPPPEANKPAEPTSAGLNSDSELSELTEEEQEADKRDKAPRKGARNDVARRGRRPSRRGGRRKTSSIVPAPMWGWAETRSSSNVVEEEEEEEMAGPPRAMEEEEDEEGGGDEDEEEEDEPDAKHVDIAPDDPPAPEEDEDESISGEDRTSYRSRRATRRSSPSRDASVDRNTKGGDDGEVEVEVEVDDEASDAEAPPAPADDPESEDDNGNETESEDEDKEAPNPTDADEPATATATPMEVDVDADMTAPLSHVIAPIAAAAAASSIMAGSTIIDPPSPSSSSPASSRSASPVGTDGEDAGDAALADEKEDDGVAPAPSVADVDATEQDGPEEQDQEAEDGDVDETNPEDDGDIEIESDLQPAHRAEALDVLATIELKFALLRERVYVEKMDSLAWEEALINEGTHPELLHLQRELSSRRDKRIELATRKRSLEVLNVNKRRRTDEDATWSWWKLSRDDLQTDMIAEANRKRRRMERERRVNDRPQPVRHLPSANQEFPAAPPLRKIVKSLPFINSRNKSSKKQRPLRLVYPELSSLSDYDVAIDLDFILQAQRERSRANIPLGGYDIQHVHRVPNPGAYPGSAPHTNGLSGFPPSHSHLLAYDGYNEPGLPNGSRPYTNGALEHRIPNPPPFPQQGPPSHHHHHLPPPPLSQPMMPHAHSHAFSGPPGSRNIHMQQPQPLPPPPLSHSHHPHGSVPHTGPPSFGGADQDVMMHASQHVHSHMPPHPHNSYFPPRRSVSPAGMGMLPNGVSTSKLSAGMNGGPSWMGSGMGMERVYPGSGSAISKGVDWGRERDRERDGRPAPEDDERERMARERDRREREREQRDRERDREMQRDRERDELERERQRDIHHMHHQQQQHQQMQQQQQQQHRHQPPPPHMHLHPGPPSTHHIAAPHHHHRPHHHHVVHHHHQPSSGTPGHSSSSLPPQGLRSPRSLQRDRDRERVERERDYDSRGHPGHNQHPTEVINLTSSKATPSQYHDQHPPPDYRDVRSKHGPGGRHTPSSSAPPGSTAPMIMDDRDRPIAMPFAIPPSHGMSTPNHGPPAAPSSMNGRSSPRSAWAEDSGFRGPSSLGPSSGPPPPGPPSGNYHGPSHEVGAPHTRSPSQSHRYASNGVSLGRGPPPPMTSSQQPSRQNSLGLHSPPRPTLPRPPAPPSPPPSSSAPTPYSNPNPNPNPNPNRSPSRFVAPRSPPVSLKMRAPSPHSNKMPAPYTVLSGPGPTLTPTLETKNGNGPGYPGGGRAPEPMMPFQGPSRGYMGPNGTNEREKERERERPPPPHFGPPPPPPAPPKMSVPQMVDGH